MRRIVILAAVPAAILLSCQRERGLEESAVLPAGETGASSGRLISFTTDSLETRDGVSVMPVASFGVFAVGSSTGEEVMCDQMVRRAKGGYTYSPLKYFPDEGLDIMAYAPYGSSSVSFPRGTGLTTDIDFSLPETLSDDVLLAGPLREVHTSPVLLSFIHPLTRISTSFAFSPLSVEIPSGKGVRITSLSLSHCIREGSFNLEEGRWSSKGEFEPALRSGLTIANGHHEVNAGALYSIPFTAPAGAMLEIGWEAFNLDSGAATRRYSVGVNIAGRDFPVSQNTSFKVNALWYNDTITFEDEEAERVCVAAFDTDGDGALSFVEAEIVTDLGNVFHGNERIEKFNEFVYFTGVETMTGYLKGSFAYMSSLKEITLPPSVRAVGGWPFAHCPSLENIFVDPDNPRYYSVDGCLYSRPDKAIVRVPEKASFDTYDIPSGILSVGYGCFASNSTIKELHIGKDVTSIAGEALKINSLEKVTVDPSSRSLAVLDNALYSIVDGEPKTLLLLPQQSGVSSLVLPLTVKTIFAYALTHVTSLRSLILNEGLDSINQYAFNGLSLEGLIIPSTVTDVRECALRFTHIPSLTVLPLTPPSLEGIVFPLMSDEENTPYPIYVPASSLDLYRNDPSWSAVASRIYPLQ